MGPIDRAGLFDALPDAYVVLTPDLVVAHANAACCTIAGRTLDALVGRRIEDAFAVDPADPAASTRLASAYREVLSTKVETDIGTVRYDLPLDGAPVSGAGTHGRRWSVHVTPVLAGSGAVELLLQRVREVTDAPAELATALATELAQMREAMASRAVIEQAKGVLMAQCPCTDDEAFALLVGLSQHTNRKLRDVCRTLVSEPATVGRPRRGLAEPRRPR